MKLLVRRLKVEGEEYIDLTDMHIVEFDRLDGRNDTFCLQGTLIANLKLFPYKSEVPGVIYEGQSLCLKKISGHSATGDLRNTYEITVID